VIGWSKLNERIHDMIPNGKLLNVSVSPKKKDVKTFIYGLSLHCEFGSLMIVNVAVQYVVFSGFFFSTVA
jgi:hypothetical protein